MNDGWHRRELKEVATVDWGDTSITKSSYVPTGVPAYSAAGPDGFVETAQYSRLGVVVSAIGARCGRCFLAEGRWTAIKNTIVVLPDEDKLLTRYLFQITEARNIWPIDGGAQPFIGIGKAKCLEIEIPPIPEQEVIARILGTWDTATTVTEQLLIASQKRKRGLMEQLVTGEKRFKELNGAPWRTVQIGALLQECDRYVIWSDDTTYRFASIRRRSGGLFDRGTFHGHEVKTKVLKLLKEGDFVVSKRQVSHGAWAMVTNQFEGFGVSDEYDVLVNRDPKKLDMRFFNYLSQTRRLWHMAYLASNGVHIEKLIFVFDDFAKEKIKIPSTIEEQAKIAGMLSACDLEIDLLGKQLRALKEQKRGLMQKLLTGELRVKVPRES